MYMELNSGIILNLQIQKNRMHILMKFVVSSAIIMFCHDI